MLHEYDNNHDGTISYDEFKHYITQREADMAAAFRAFDEDGNGEISATELGKVGRWGQLHLMNDTCTATARHAL
jgi:Ca2+-binding EF-hand superfamily protein